MPGTLLRVRREIVCFSDDPDTFQVLDKGTVVIVVEGPVYSEEFFFVLARGNVRKVFVENAHSMLSIVHTRS